MSEQTTKHAFVSGKPVFIDGKYYTQLYTKEEIKQSTRLISNEEMDETERWLEQKMKQENPELHRKLYPEQYKLTYEKE